MTDEIWKPMIGCDGIYSVSSVGRVRRDKAARGTKIGKILKSYINKRTGYVYIGLQVNRKQKFFQVSHLVVYAFIGPRRKGYQINHKDLVKTNNDVRNLEYLTPKENVHHAHANRYWELQACRGEKSCLSKITEKQAVAIRQYYAEENITQNELAKIYGIKQSAVSRIVNKNRWAHI